MGHTNGEAGRRRERLGSKKMIRQLHTHEDVIIAFLRQTRQPTLHLFEENWRYPQRKTTEFRSACPRNLESLTRQGVQLEVRGDSKNNCGLDQWCSAAGYEAGGRGEDPKSTPQMTGKRGVDMIERMGRAVRIVVNITEKRSIGPKSV